MKTHAPCGFVFILHFVVMDCKFYEHKKIVAIKLKIPTLNESCTPSKTQIYDLMK